MQKYPFRHGVHAVYAAGNGLYDPAAHGIGTLVPAAQRWPAGHTAPPTLRATVTFAALSVAVGVTRTVETPRVGVLTDTPNAQ